MKKTFLYKVFPILILLALTGCNSIGTKSANVTIVYGITVILSFLLLIGYCCLTQEKDIWFLLLFSSVFIINIGYFALSISTNLQEALLANRISYLGSVFLPMSMLMIISKELNFKYPKYITTILLFIGFLIFLIAASPGYLNIYYKEVSLEIVNGATILNKTYGSWHCIYLYYLLFYFGSMIGIILYAYFKKQVSYLSHVIIPAIAVSVNLGVWFLEQMVKINFEFLAISYIITELFLLGLHKITSEYKNLKKMIDQQTIEPENDFHAAKAVTTDNPLSFDEQNITFSTIYDSNTTANSIHYLIFSDVSQNKSDRGANNLNLVELQSTITSEQTNNTNKTPDIHQPTLTISSEQRLIFDYYLNGLEKLTKTEHVIFSLYTGGKTTKEILSELNITENTLKFHNKNIYAKLGVSSRKQLLAIYKQLSTSDLKP